MQNLVERLDENGVLEENNVPWGELVVLSEKPHQENAPWNEYQWRLCVSYQIMNQVTWPFTFPIPHHDDAMQDIDTEAKYLLQWIWAVGIVK